MKTPLLPKSSSLGHPTAYLKSLYVLRREKNQHYSLNAFARDLQISSVQLYRIFNGSRSLSLKTATVVGNALGLKDSELDEFLRGAVIQASPRAKVKRQVREWAKRGTRSQRFTLSADTLHLGVDRFRLIAKWYHVAILNLTYLKSFKSDAGWIARRLGIKRVEAEEAVDRMLQMGLLKVDADSNWVANQSNLFFGSDRSEAALRAYEKQMIEKAQAALADPKPSAFRARLVNGATFPCSSTQVEEIKNRILQFQREILELIRSCEAPYDEVYQLNTQLFSLTQSKKPQEI